MVAGPAQKKPQANEGTLSRGVLTLRIVVAALGRMMRMEKLSSGELL